MGTRPPYKVLAAGLVPIVEPEVDITSDTKAGPPRAAPTAQIDPGLTPD
jgi:fructose-bisphosphate aldolase class 1